MDKQFMAFLISMTVCILLGMMIGAKIVQDRNCTVTITDMRGVQHVIKGKADE